MTSITLTKPEVERLKKCKPIIVEKEKGKKRSALEISDAIGIYGAFGHTLSDLHKQGR